MLPSYTRRSNRSREPNGRVRRKPLPGVPPHGGRLKGSARRIGLLFVAPTFGNDPALLAVLHPPGAGGRSRRRQATARATRSPALPSRPDPLQDCVEDPILTLPFDPTPRVRCADGTDRPVSASLVPLRDRHTRHGKGDPRAASRRARARGLDRAWSLEGGRLRPYRLSLNDDASGLGSSPSAVRPVLESRLENTWGYAPASHDGS